MKIQLLSIGKKNEDYVDKGIQEFSKRITKYYPIEWKIIAPPKNAASLSEKELKRAEAPLVLDKLDDNDFLVLLDERGKNISSPETAKLIEKAANQGIRNLVFLIGGAFGVDDAVFKRANFTWSLSQLVFPHMLVRLILSEQVYRACTIIKGEKYHHM